MLQKSWAEKYRPRTLDDLIFPSNNIKNVVEKWYSVGYISENVLLFGKPGTGKSTLIKILVNDFIKNAKDVFILGRKVDDIDKLGGWIQSAPVASKFKIVVVEEIDRLSPAAFLQLKEKYMEKFQGQVAFLGATNNPHKVDPAVRTRFNLKINFDNLPFEQIATRLKKVLDQEKVQYDPDQIDQFAQKHAKKGMRELLNLLQIASITGQFDPSALGALVGITEEDNIVKLADYIIKFNNAVDKNLIEVLYKNPLDPNYYEKYGKVWVQLENLVNNFPDIDYDYIYNKLITEQDYSLNIKKTLMNSYNNLEFKIFKNLHFLAGLVETIEDIKEIK